MTERSLKEKVFLFLLLALGISLIISSILSMLIDSQELLLVWWQTQGILFFLLGFKGTQKAFSFWDKLQDLKGYFKL